MRILDILAGRTRPAQANLDALFALSSAFITLEASESLVPSGEAGVCYKPTAGQSFARTTHDLEGLLGLGGGPAKVREETDQYGFHWIVISSVAGSGSVDSGGSGTGDPQALVNQIHVVNSTLEEDGFGPSLLCSVFGFLPASGGPATATTYVVYLYKRGTFYPFVPLPGTEKRDVESELRLGIVLSEDLKIEKDKERWMALWNLPIH